MSEQHTPGRLRAGKPGGSIVAESPLRKRDLLTPGADYYGGYLIAESMSAEDRRRMIACWNACVEFSTEALEDDAPIKLREDRDQLLVQIEHSRARFDQLVQILVGVHALLYPPVMTLDDGRTFVFRPTDPDPHQLLQSLSDRIRAIPDEIAKATGSVS